MWSYIKMIFPLLLASFLPIRTLILPKIIESKYLQVGFSHFFRMTFVGTTRWDFQGDIWYIGASRCWTGCIPDIHRLPWESAVCRFLSLFKFVKFGFTKYLKQKVENAWKVWWGPHWGIVFKKLKLELARLYGNFLDSPESFRTVQKVLRQYGNIPDCLETFQTVRKLSRLSRN